MPVHLRKRPFVICWINLSSRQLTQRALKNISPWWTLRVTLLLLRETLKFKNDWTSPQLLHLSASAVRHKAGGVCVCVGGYLCLLRWVGVDWVCVSVCVCRGGVFKPLAASHSSARASDSEDTWSHLSAVYTFLSWSLSYGGDQLSHSKKESKRAGPAGGGREGGSEGWMDGRRGERGGEKRQAGAVCVNAGRDCKARWALTAKCANFLCLWCREGPSGHEARDSEGLLSQIFCWVAGSWFEETSSESTGLD